MHARLEELVDRHVEDVPSRLLVILQDCFTKTNFFAIRISCFSCLPLLREEVSFRYLGVGTDLEGLGRTQNLPLKVRATMSICKNSGRCPPCTLMEETHASADNLMAALFSKI